MMSVYEEEVLVDINGEFYEAIVSFDYTPEQMGVTSQEADFCVEPLDEEFEFLTLKLIKDDLDISNILPIVEYDLIMQIKEIAGESQYD